MQPEPFTNLSDGVALWVGDLDRHEQTNVGVVRGGDSIVVIDANFEWAATRILAGIREQEHREVSHVVNTHYHVDHTLGNPVFADAGATIVGAAGQRRELLEKGPEDAMIQIGTVPPRWSPATLEFTGSIVFPDSKLELMAVGPAHTEADVVAWLPEDRIVFVGDLAVAWAHGNNFSDVDADMEGWILALSRCIALRPRIVVPAHGRVADVQILTQQRDFTEDLWAWGLDAASSGQDEPSVAEIAAFLERHPEFAVSPDRFTGMAGSMLTAARRTQDAGS